MGHLDFLIRDLALILIVAGITTVIFKKINQPLVLGYVLAGFLTGSNFHMLPTIVDPANINIWGELGVIFIMFALGLEFSFHKIANIGGSAIVTASTIITAMIFIGYGVGNLMGWQKMDSIFLGGMIAMSSTMIILKAYEEYGLKNRKYAQLVLGTLILEDVAAIFMMIVLATIAVSKDISGFELSSEIAKMMLYLVLWLMLGIYMIPSLLKKADKYLKGETLLITALGLCLGMVVIANLMGFSSALGAFMAGSILAGTVKGEIIEEQITPIKDLFGAVFFVSVGMLVDPAMIVKYIVPIMILTLVTIFGQMTFSFIGVLLSGQSLKTAVGAGMSMVQIGEFSFIIASLGKTLGVTSDFLYPIVVSVSVITTFTTPLFIKNADNAYKFISKLLPTRTLKTLHKYTSENQTENEKDPDWKNFLHGYIPRTLITSLILLCIYLVGIQVLPGYILRYVDTETTAKVLSATIAIIFMLPAINLMSYKCNNIYLKLWLKNKANRLPLEAFKGVRILISMFFIMSAIRTVADIPGIFPAAVALIIVILTVKSDFMASKSIQIETRFIANFNQKILAQKKKESGMQGSYKWLDETLLVKEYVLKELIAQEPEKDLFFGNKLGVQIIKVIQGEKHINNPGSNVKLQNEDIIVALGKSHNLESYDMILSKVAKYEESSDTVSLKDYTYRQIFISTDVENHLICMAVRINTDCEFYNKTIQSSGVKENYHGFIIGIERAAFHIVGPNKNTKLEDGDIIWILGTQFTADRLIQKGVIL